MPFDQQHREEMQRRARTAEARRLVELRPVMNDTKWREVFSVIAARGIWFQVQLIDPQWTSGIIAPSRVSGVVTSEDWVDGLVGGGFYLRELLWMRCPAVVPGELVKSVAPRKQDLVGLCETLQTLGKLPIVQEEAYLEIRGYEH